MIFTLPAVWTSDKTPLDADLEHNLHFNYLLITKMTPLRSLPVKEDMQHASISKKRDFYTAATLKRHRMAQIPISQIECQCPIPPLLETLSFQLVLSSSNHNNRPPSPLKAMSSWL